MDAQDLKTVEVKGKDVEEAIQKALRLLGAKRKDTEIEILSEGHKGLFGMKGPKPAKVRAKIKKEKDSDLDIKT